MPRTILPLLLASLTVTFGHAAAQNHWPQWRGPLGTGEAPGTKPPLKWSETENVKWKTKIPGRGTGTPIIWDQQVFIQTAIPTGKIADVAPPSGVPAAQVRGDGDRPNRGGGRPGRGGEQPTEEHRFVLMALDRNTGKVLWEKVAATVVPHEGHHQDHAFASASPVTDGEQVFAFFGSRGLYAFDMKGNLQWSKDLGKMRTRNGFGEGSSPALHGDTIVVNWDHEGEDDFTVAFNKKTGQELWRAPREEPTSWTTPLIVEHGGKTQVITAATSKIRSYELKTGKLIWECGGLTVNAIPTPVVGNGLVYVTSGFRGAALLAIRLDRTGDLTGTDAIVWQHNKSTPYVPSPLLYENRLYFFSGNTGILSCFDAKQGKPLFDAERLDALRGVYASPVGAGGRVYLVGRDGTSLVIKSGDKLEVLARNKLDDNIDASPAMVGNQVFLRSHNYLYCLAE